jgi:DNA-damage-inducible protein J
MSEDAIVEAHIDSEIRDKAEKVLQEAGMTIPELMRLVLTRTAEDGTVPYGLQGEDPGYDQWFREQVQEALDEPGPFLSHDEANREMAEYKADLIKKHGLTGT